MTITYKIVKVGSGGFGCSVAPINAPTLSDVSIVETDDWLAHALPFIVLAFATIVIVLAFHRIFLYRSQS